MTINRPEGQMNPDHDEDVATADTRKAVASFLKTLEANIPAVKRLFWHAFKGLNILLAAWFFWMALLPGIMARECPSSDPLPASERNVSASKN